MGSTHCMDPGQLIASNDLISLQSNPCILYNSYFPGNSYSATTENNRIPEGLVQKGLCVLLLYLKRNIYIFCEETYSLLYTQTESTANKKPERNGTIVLYRFD